MQFKESTLKCKECSNVFKPTSLEEIPEDKITEQQERYKAYRKKSNNIGDLLVRGVGPKLDFFNENWDEETEIVECDAGYHKILVKEEEARKAKAQKRQQERKRAWDEMKPFLELGRNRPCACESGKKYKKCCMHRIEDLRRKYRV